MREDLDDYRRIFDASDDLQAAAAVGAAFDVDIEDPFEQSGPTRARRFSLTLGVIDRGLGGTLCRSGNDFTAQLRVGRQHAVGFFKSERRATLDVLAVQLPGLKKYPEVLEKCYNVFAPLFEPTLTLPLGSLRAAVAEVALQDSRAGIIDTAALVERII